jgi:hypothetical protein
VHCGQRVAFIEIEERQKGHSLVVGSSTVLGAFCNRLAALITRKMAKAIIIKLMMVLRNNP